MILLVALIVSGANYLGGRPFQWAFTQANFLYSFFLTLGFLASIVAGLFGALKESEEFLIASGAACLVLAVLNKVFSNLLYSWGYVDVVLLLAGALMIVDRFHVKRIKEARRALQRLEELNPDQLLERLDRLRSEPTTAEMSVAVEEEMADVKRRLLIEAEKSPEVLRMLRVRLYKSPMAQTIVKRFVEKRLQVIEPAVEAAGRPTYPQLSDLEQYPPEKVQSTLTELVESGILSRDLYEKLVTCPRCHQPSKVFMRNKCPKCGSHKTHMNRLIEHLKCGAIYDFDAYHVAGEHRCPKCGTLIEEDSELKPVGVSFRCEACGNAFSDPVQTYHCRRCSAEFELKSGELTDTYSYMLNDAVRSEAKETMTVLSLADAIERLGYKVKVLGSLKGKTGVSHEFTLTAGNDDRLVVLDLRVAEGKVSMATTLSSYAKLVDVPATTRLIIAMPRLEAKARSFLDANRIPFIEGQNVSEISGKVIQLLA